MINGSYSRRFNERHNRNGALFDSRFRSWAVRDDRHLQNTIRYIARNPVPDLVAHPADWPWSTYGQLIGHRTPWAFFDPAPVLGQFASRRDEAVAGLRAVVESGLGA